MTDGIRDEQGVRRFVEHMAMSWSDWGFPRMPARVLMTLTAADEDALTAAELAERLAASPAAISGAVRYLIQIGMVAREPAPGSRRDRYRMPDDAWYQTSATKTALFKVIVDIADDGITAIGGQDTPSVARITEMRDFFAFMATDIQTLLERWHDARATPED